MAKKQTDKKTNEKQSYSFIHMLNFLYFQVCVSLWSLPLVLNTWTDLMEPLLLWSSLNLNHVAPQGLTIQIP